MVKMVRWQWPLGGRPPKAHAHFLFFVFHSTVMVADCWCGQKMASVVDGVQYHGRMPGLVVASVPNKPVAHLHYDFAFYGFQGPSLTCRAARYHRVKVPICTMHPGPQLSFYCLCKIA
ncbi:hypothetical protein QBC46DRAFT_45226 [Diplogelasinospora grovesii]|uniref:Uncharacterized protein n=1 Tax=Diplogelasinospora grovesii TaxID=303347 RepID=A0AAN6RZJ7_9PEZI|nr:hypothetical protein QBC46DRAFT_45226 [Diplogelasinospora grovesii]